MPAARRRWALLAALLALGLAALHSTRHTASLAPFRAARHARSAAELRGRRLARSAGVTGSRGELQAELFACLDADGDGTLRWAELRRFAECTGFDGSAEDWNEEYAFLCENLGCQPAEGLSFSAFSQLVDDDSEEGCYCSDAELAKMLQQAQRKGAAAARAPSAPRASVVAGADYFEAERKQGLYEGGWRPWKPPYDQLPRAPCVGNVPVMAGCPSTATPQEAIMFLYDQVQEGIFGEAGPAVEQRLGELLGLASGGQAKAGWFDFRLEEDAVGESQLAQLVLAPEGWKVDKATIPKGYMMHIVSVGNGASATLCGREGTHIINSLHRDVSKCNRLCDTCLCGVLGRKRVVLFAPNEFSETTGWARKPDFASHDLRALTYLPEEEAWSKLEALASRSDVGGGVTDLEPGKFVFVPHGWWHAVRPVDAFTLITGPSQLSQLAVQT